MSAFPGSLLLEGVIALKFAHAAHNLSPACSSKHLRISCPKASAVSCQKELQPTEVDLKYDAVCHCARCSFVSPDSYSAASQNPCT